MPTNGDRPATKKTALVTGASSGLGLELAQLCAADGHDVVLVARRKAELEALAARLVAERGGQAHGIADDLSHATAPARPRAAVRRRGPENQRPGNPARLAPRG